MSQSHEVLQATKFSSSNHGGGKMKIIALKCWEWPLFHLQDLMETIYIYIYYIIYHRSLFPRVLWWTHVDPLLPWLLSTSLLLPSPWPLGGVRGARHYVPGIHQIPRQGSLVVHHLKGKWQTYAKSASCKGDIIQRPPWLVSCSHMDPSGFFQICLKFTPPGPLAFPTMYRKQQENQRKKMRKQGVAVDVSKVVLGQPRQKMALPIPGFFIKCVFCFSIQHCSKSLAHWAPPHHHTPCGIAPSKSLMRSNHLTEPNQPQSCWSSRSWWTSVCCRKQIVKHIWIFLRFTKQHHQLSTTVYCWHTDTLKGMFYFPASGTMNRSDTQQHVTGEDIANSQNITLFNILRQLQSVSVCSLPLLHLQLYEQLWPGFCKR